MEMNYVDGYVTAVPALSVVECWGDDVPEDKLTSFSMAVQRRPDEVVVFSWIA